MILNASLRLSISRDADETVAELSTDKKAEIQKMENARLGMNVMVWKN